MAFNKEKAHDRAERFATKGQYEKAAREYQAIVDNDPKDTRAWLMLADALARSGRKEEAIARYASVAEHYRGHREFNKALAVYRQIINIDPRRADVLSKAALIHQELGRPQEAIAAYDQVANLRLEDGKASEAITAYLKALELEPTAIPRRLRLAELYSKEGRREHAVEQFRLAGQRLLDEGRTPDYIRVAERLLYHNHQDAQTLGQVARVYLERGDPRKALVKLNALLQTNPRDRQGLELLAQTFIGLGKPDKAVSVVVELARDVRSENPREALRMLRRGFEWQPEHAELNALKHELEQQVENTLAGRRDPHGLGLDGGEDDIVELGEDDVVETARHFTMTDLPTVSRRAPQDTQAHEVANETVMVPPPRPAAPRVAPGSGPPPPMPRPGGAAAMGASLSGAPLDADKVVFEARVYIKYKLFEHALEHLSVLLVDDPEHTEALEMRARALGELGRAEETANAYVTLAKQLLTRDPKRASEHVASALAADPEHAVALALRRELGEASFADVRPQTAVVPAPPAPQAEAVPRPRPEPPQQRGSDEPSGLAFAVEFAEGSQRFDLESDEAPQPAQTPPSATEVVAGAAAAEAAEAAKVTEDADLGDFLRDVLSDESEVAPPPAADARKDLTDDIAEIRFFIDQGLDEDAEHALRELEAHHQNDPQVIGLREEIGVSRSVDSGAAAQPLTDLAEEDAEADAYVSTIFSDEVTDFRGRETVVKAQVAEGDDDPQTLYDLGTAYREMGLVDDAIAQFEAASRDPNWRARALLMIGALRLHRGDVDQAMTDFTEAAEAASQPSEVNESHYELALAYENRGDHGRARHHLQQVEPGFRDRDERLAALTG